MLLCHSQLPRLLLMNLVQATAAKGLGFQDYMVVSQNRGTPI